MHECVSVVGYLQSPRPPPTLRKPWLSRPGARCRDCSRSASPGRSAAHNGKVKATYTDATGKLKVLATGGNLHLYNVNCFGVINNGDSVNFTATYTLIPKQTITSP
jgi:hypothetical protein